LFAEDQNMLFNVSRPGRAFLSAALLLAPLTFLACSGCELLGVAAHDVENVQGIAPAYTGLKGQHVGIMVWADEGISTDHPRINADVAGGLKDKLQQGVDAKADELKNTTFFSTSKILQYQEAHPEAQSDSAEDAAKQFPVTRLIYIEIQSLSLHPGESDDLWRGQVVATVKVLEVNDGMVKVAYSNENVTGEYPPHAPPEGLPNLSDEQVYTKTMDALTTEMGKLFITHDDDTDDSPNN
jgi:hypothetical protein